MDHELILAQAATNAVAAGKITSDQRDQVMEIVNQLSGKQRRELMKAMAVDWSQLISILPKVLPMLFALIPGVGPFAGIFTALLPFILSLLNQDPNPNPPVPVIDGGTIPPTPLS